MSFARDLITWNQLRDELYPWIGESDPYKILLSEFLLQQTRSDQALAYYTRMLHLFPNVTTLANATEDELLRAWQGLGYYSRARNLHKTAKRIVSDHNSRVPKTYVELLNLPGIGPYTASAISSFAFGERRPVVDGNVYRVLSRVMEDATPINTPKAHQHFVQIACELLGESDIAAFNQAMMNLGAHVCLPKKPRCSECPVRSYCGAFSSSMQAAFPVKKKPRPKQHRYFHYIDIHYKNKGLIEKRHMDDIWKGLYQLPLIENRSPHVLDENELLQFLSHHFAITTYNLNEVTPVGRQTLSHQYIHARFYRVQTAIKPDVSKTNYSLVNRENLETFALPKTIVNYLNTS